MAIQESEEKIDHFDRLPEVCIADTISYTTPVDACRLALVSPAFRLIADSDAVWERFLPSDYTQIISRADQLLPISPKKNLYMSLCDHPLAIDAGALSFSLDKLTGKKCIMITAKALDVVDEDVPQKVKFHGRINTSLLSPDTTYTTYLVYKPSTEIHGRDIQQPDPLTWIDRLMGTNGEVFLTFYNLSFLYLGETQQKIRMKSRRRGGKIYNPSRGSIRRYPRTRNDGWLEIELSEYLNKEGANRELKITFEALWRHSLMLNSIFEGLEFRPKGSSK